MSHLTKTLSLEEFTKSRVKDRRGMLEASQRIDEFRRKYGKTDKNFHSTEIIRKMRDARQ